MKRMICHILLGLLFTINGFLLFAQDGIRFEQGDWATILAKAKSAQKPIFIDVYTSWCGPCKKMAKDIFPLKRSAKNSMLPL